MLVPLATLVSAQAASSYKCGYCSTFINSINLGTKFASIIGYIGGTSTDNTLRIPITPW